MDQRLKSMMAVPGLYLLDCCLPLVSSEEPLDDAWDTAEVDFHFVCNLRYGLFQLRIKKESATFQKLLPYVSDYPERMIEAQLRLCVNSGLLMQSVECCNGEHTVVYDDFLLNFGKRKRSLKVDGSNSACQAIRMALKEIRHPLTVAEVGLYVKNTFPVNIDEESFGKAYVRSKLEQLVDEGLVRVAKRTGENQVRFSAVEQQKQPSTLEKKTYNVQDFLDQKMFVPEEDADSDNDDSVDVKDDYKGPRMLPPLSLPSRPPLPGNSRPEIKPFDLRAMEQQRILPKWNLVTMPNETFRFSPEDSISPPPPTVGTVATKYDQIDDDEEDPPIPVQVRTSSSRQPKIEKKRSPSMSESPTKTSVAKKRSRKLRKKEEHLSPLPVAVVEPLLSKPGLAFRRPRLDSL
ncbi:hypothetical protein RvY_02279 [Ramazzottius varieornatus]|uniref:H15 domain-containing protein n=1 Tax=Ramazzottius varieornatus TaxID=947166 RepID=A0A1D1UUB5_RAMVA|nr:hypothetical protein RvY_02279 [Ramazzottius varieornatus]